MQRVADAVVDGIIWLLGRVFRRSFIWLDYPPQAHNAPRYGYDRPPNPHLLALFERSHGSIRTALELVESQRAGLSGIPLVADVDDPSMPCWENEFMTGLDAAFIYALLRASAPASYLEIGSGNSTRFAHRAIRDGGLNTTITSVDPAPRLGIDALCDTFLSMPLEKVDLAIFDDIETGDVIFLDGSHRVFMNNDVSTFFLDVLPNLPAGVHVGIHDVFFPDDYPPEWAERHYSEQYMLGARLLSGGSDEVILPCAYVEREPAFSELLDSIWSDEPLEVVPRGGVAFWFRTGC